VTAVMILGLQGRCTIKSMAKFLASMFTGVAPDLVCCGFPAASPASSRTRDRIKD